MDADADSSDEYTTSGHAPVLVRLDTNVEDAALSGPIELPPACESIKLYADNESAGRAITVSAQINSILSDETESETQITWT